MPKIPDFIFCLNRDPGVEVSSDEEDSGLPVPHPVGAVVGYGPELRSFFGGTFLGEPGWRR